MPRVANVQTGMLYSNHAIAALGSQDQLINALLQKFAMIKVPGALDDGEIDSLQYIALFCGEKLVTASSDWLQVAMDD